MATTYRSDMRSEIRSTAMHATLRKVILSSLVTSLFSLSACSSVIENIGFEAPEMNHTVVGAATGGAIGAGLGAIIGSTTGDAGEGLLIGTGVGALAGAAVGAEIQAQDDMLASHKSTISQQEEEIRQQHEEIQRFKSGGMDLSSFQNGRYVIPEQNRSSRVAFGGKGGTPTASNYVASARGAYRPEAALPDTARVANKRIRENDLLASNLRKQLSSDSDVIETSSNVAPILPVAKRIMAEPVRSAPLKAAATKKTSVVKKATAITNARVIEKAPLVRTPSKRPVMQVPETTQVFASKKSITTIEDDSAKIVKEVKTEVTKELSDMSPVKANKEIAKVASNGSCLDAESEVSRARNAASDTDKLFYYRRALRLCKTKPEYHVEIGRVYTSIGRREEAEFEFSRALEIDPENRDAQDELTMLMLNNTY